MVSTENKSQTNFSNIREIQNLIRSNGISRFAASLKSLKQRLSLVGTKIVELKKQSAPETSTAKEKVQVKPVQQDAAPKQVSAENTETKSNYQQSGQPSQTRFAGKDNFGHGRGFNSQNGAGKNVGFQPRQNNGQNGFNRPNGAKFTPTGERRFDGQTGERKPGSFNSGFGGQFNRNNPNFKPGDRPFNKFQNKPGATGAANGPYKPRLAKPTETYDASTLTKNSLRAIPKKKTYEKTGEEKKTMNKKALLARGYAQEENREDTDVVRRYNKKSKDDGAEAKKVVQKIDHAVITTDNLTVKILAETIGKSVPELISKFMLLGIMVNINSNIDYDSAELVASEFGIKLEKNVEKTFEEKLADQYANQTDDEKDLVKRPAVVCVLGHVDHGKTSLLDNIRKTNVVEGEAGGITQSIGAYTIKVNGEDITFIDTPGHAAFGAMRERGAKLTDIAILIVAADDGVMPQTVECIKQIKEAKVPMIVAINKIDKPGANIDNVKTQLATYDVLPEEWGGDAIMVPISAKQGTGLDKLLEMILFVADYQNLTANPKRQASGSIIEAKLDKGVGAVATVLVQNGTLKVGDYVVVGTCTGKIRAMMNDKNERIKSAGPSIAVQIMGLSGVPNAGDELYVVDEKMSRQVALERQNTAKVNMIKSADLSLENMMNKIADSNFKDFNVIVKADVQGSVEALKQSLCEIQNEEVKVRFVSGSVGAINENDVSLAQASNSVIIAFNTKTDFKAKVLADKYKVEIKNSKIIYEILDYVKEKIDKMVAPKYKEVVTGHAEIRATFKASKVGLIAGTYVLDGKISKTSKVRVFRGEEKIFEGEILSLQREKNEAKSVDAGYECGVTFNGFKDFTIGDTFETYDLVRIN